MKFLGNRSQKEFLQNFWDKEFLHIPSAIEVPSNAIVESDLLDMITDEYFESRLIEEKDQIKVTEGPLDIKSLKELTGKWTIMIHNLNLYNEFALQLEKEVEFIPKWLFDDVMCSFSSKGSKINAHVDKYNVFILQISGTRKWLIEKKPNTKYKENCELRVLENFNPDSEYILKPGDMIYVPPQVAHEGHTIDDSISLSIGFKSIEDKDLIESFLISFLENFESEEFYKTNFKDSSAEDPFVLESKIVDQIHQKATSLISDKDNFTKWLNYYLAQPKNRPEFKDDSLNIEDFSFLVKNNEFFFDEFIRMTCTKQRDSLLVNINNISFDLNHEQYSELKDMISNKHTERHIKEDTKLMGELYTLYKNGLIIFPE